MMAREMARQQKLLLIGEIRSIVADAGNRVVSAGREALRLADVYPDCGMTIDQIATKIAIEAACAGVPVEASLPKGEASKLSSRGDD